MDSEIYAWDKIFARDGRVLTEHLPFFDRCLALFSSSGVTRILDLGCGNGRHVVGFKESNFDVIGFDISPAGLSLTRKWLDEKGLEAGLVRGDSRCHLPFSASSFQGLISANVIHHALIAEIRETISEIWRILAPGGIGMVSVAGRKHPGGAYREIEPGTYLPLNGDEKGLFHHIFTEEELRGEFSAFEILESGPRADGKVQVIWFKKGG